MALCFTKNLISYCQSKFYIARMGIFYNLFLLLWLWLWSDHLHIRTCPVFPRDNTGSANMNLLRQGCQKLSSGRQRVRQTDRQTRPNLYTTPLRMQMVKIALTRMRYSANNLSDKVHTLSIVALIKHFWKRLWSCTDVNSTWKNYLHWSIIAMLEHLTLDMTYCIRIFLTVYAK